MYMYILEITCKIKKTRIITHPLTSPPSPPLSPLSLTSPPHPSPLHSHPLTSPHRLHSPLHCPPPHLNSLTHSKFSPLADGQEKTRHQSPQCIAEYIHTHTCTCIIHYEYVYMTVSYIQPDITLDYTAKKTTASWIQTSYLHLACLETDRETAYWYTLPAL